MIDEIARIELAADKRAPYFARTLVGALTSAATSIRAVDLVLITSELVTMAVDRAPSIELTIAEGEDFLRVEVAPSTVPANDIVATLLDRLASRWGQADTVWVEVDIRRAVRLTDSDDGHLWEMLPDHDARSELFDRYQGFARALARRFTRSRVAFDDLSQVAAIGLVNSIDRFDPERGVKFTTFAAKTISGELKRHMRDTSWSMRVPRSLKEASLRLRRTENELSQSLGRDPTVEELAEAASMDEEEVLAARQASAAYTAGSLDRPLDNDDDTSVSLAMVLGVEDPALERAEAWMAVEKAMQALDERERHILYLRYFEDMSQTEIAEAVGVSQMHVSRLLARSLSDIRSTLGVEASAVSD